MDPPYVGTVCKWCVFFSRAVVLDATVARLCLPPVATPAEVTEAAALRRRRLWCAVAGVAQGALALRRRMAFVLLPDLALQALAVAALAATAASLLMEVRLIEIGVHASGLRRFPFARGIVAALRTAVRVAALVGFPAAVWVPDA